ncbi:MAG: accessory factor UbiK family protein [Gammaproteobacteria bacterium]|nr:accessory factor UbiK family protein [Gammaproteobacteria bacterium]
MDAKFIEDLARKLAANVPGSVRVIQADLERNFQALLASTFDRLNLVTREEFDVQRKVLERTRDKLTALEAELAALKSGRGGSQRGS